jgi:hypothetical protein
MSLENELKKNTTALEAMTAALLASQSGTYKTPEGDNASMVQVSLAAPAPAPAPAAPAPLAPGAPVTAAVGSTATPITAPAAVLMTPEEFNTALVAEMTRINQGRTPIDAVMGQMGITSVVGLTAEQQATLMTTVKAISA